MMSHVPTAFTRYLLLLALALGLSACGVTERMGKRVDNTWAGDVLFSSADKLVLTSDAGNHLNPDEAGKPLSVVLRVYQLTSLERFATVNADSLWLEPQKALGSTLVDSRELTLRPGIGQVDTIVLPASIGYVGVAAFFRNEKDSRWKVAFDAKSLRKEGVWSSEKGLRLLVDNNYILATRGKDVLATPITERALARGNPIPASSTHQKVQLPVEDQAIRSARDAGQKTFGAKFDSRMEDSR